MIAYKGFTKDLTARLGKGVFQYEIGKKYTEKEAKCANTGFHCVEEPIRVFEWYDQEDDRYCIVKIDKDIHEDGANKISAARICILREISRVEIAVLQCKWMMDHPRRKYSNRVQEKGKARHGIAVTRGKNPCAAGKIGDYLFLCQEDSKGEIYRFEVYIVDGKDIASNTYINIDGEAV